MFDTANAETRGETELVVIRDFASAPEAVFRALTDPEILPHWMAGPEGWTLTVEEMSWGIGDRYRWRFTENVTGKWMGFSGEVRAYDPPRSFSVTEDFEPGTVGGSMGSGAVLVQTVEPSERGARLTVIVTYPTAEDRAAAIASGMTKGMEKTYATLDSLIGELV